jgi:exosome complex RNA-binding protein Rrp42 (RNase PH superfamily)
MWHRLKNGMTSYRWTVPQDISEEYRKQTSVEFKKITVEKKTGKKIWTYVVPSKKDNHLTDCDQMALVSALMDGRIREILWSSGEELINQQQDQ